MQCLLIAILSLPSHYFGPEPVEQVVSKPTITVARFARVNNEATAPITLAPDPDYPEHPEEAAFRKRWSDSTRKTYSEPAASAVSSVAGAPQHPASPPSLTPVSQPVAKAAKAAAKVARKPLEAIDRAVMRRVFVGWECSGGTCYPKYEYRPLRATAPAPTVPAPRITNSAQTPPRSYGLRLRLLPRRGR